MIERYLILKSVYPNYLIFFKKKDDIKYIGETKLIIDTFGLNVKKKVNYLIIENLDIIEIKNHNNNLYDIYYCKAFLINIIKSYMKRRKDDFLER